MKNKATVDLFIVEDNAVLSKALQADLEITFAAKPLRIHLFENGVACMEQFAKIKPPIVILDYHLDSKSPDALNGIKILDLMKRENDDVEVVMLTSEDNIAVAIKSFQHGASDFILKSETQYKKINNALYNLLKMRDMKSEAKQYKGLAIGLFVSIAVIIGGMIIIEIFAPTLLR
jgi:DNA-binding NtrC family response regulator